MNISMEKECSLSKKTNIILKEDRSDLDLHCLSFIVWICINTLGQAIWFADS